MMQESTIRSYAKQNRELVAAFSRWLVAKNYAVSTQKQYASAVREFSSFLCSNNLVRADRGTVRAFLARNSCSPHQFEALRVALIAFYKFLMFAGLVRNSPLQLIRRPKLSRPLPRCLTEKQVKHLIAAADGPRDRALIELLYASGLRASEAANLRIEDLDLDSGTLRVVCGKGRKDRVAMLGLKAADALRRYLGARNSGAVFLNAFGDPVSNVLVGKIVKDSARRAGLDGVHAHTLRHSFATHLLNRGADIRYVQELLGHERITTTVIYTHLAIADLARVHADCHPHGEHNAQR